MDKQSSQSQNNQQPVAYDTNGRPLYAAPPNPNTGGGSSEKPQAVYTKRSVGSEDSEEVRQRHDESVKRYPSLSLSEVEYVVTEVKRSSVGLFIPVGVAIFLVALIISLIIDYPLMAHSVGLMQPSAYGLVILIGILLTVLILAGSYVSVIIYRSNRLFLTNESVIQEIRTGLFSRRGQKASLGDIEDTNYRQTGIFQMMLNYGSVRLSTPGDETTYRFNYVANPKAQITKVNDAIAAFKSGRPVEG